MYKTIRRKTFWVSFWIMAIIGSLAAAGGYLFIEKIHSDNGSADQVTEIVSRWIAAAEPENFYYWAIPLVIVFFILMGLLLWGAVVASVKKTLAQGDNGEDDGPKKSPVKKDFIDHKIERDRRQRVFLHSLSILQREGRLMDFFDEDLSRYEDAQIGAAVRSIQEDCKKAVKKYIDPKPVLEGSEGETITIEAGFDIDAITLVGNVAGTPPFSGVIKHPGWKAGKKDVPKLSDVQDASIVTPAEVEIQ